MGEPVGAACERAASPLVSHRLGAGLRRTLLLFGLLIGAWVAGETAASAEERSVPGTDTSAAVTGGSPEAAGDGGAGERVVGPVPKIADGLRETTGHLAGSLSSVASEATAELAGGESPPDATPDDGEGPGARQSRDADAESGRRPDGAAGPDDPAGRDGATGPAGEARSSGSADPARTHEQSEPGDEPGESSPDRDGDAAAQASDRERGVGPADGARMAEPGRVDGPGRAGASIVVGVGQFLQEGTNAVPSVTTALVEGDLEGTLEATLGTVSSVSQTAESTVADTGRLLTTNAGELIDGSGSADDRPDRRPGQPSGLIAEASGTASPDPRPGEDRRPAGSLPTPDTRVSGSGPQPEPVPAVTRGDVRTPPGDTSSGPQDEPRPGGPGVAGAPASVGTATDRTGGGYGALARSLRARPAYPVSGRLDGVSPAVIRAGADRPAFSPD